MRYSCVLFTYFFTTVNCFLRFVSVVFCYIVFVLVYIFFMYVCLPVFVSALTPASSPPPPPPLPPSLPIQPLFCSFDGNLSQSTACPCSKPSSSPRFFAWMPSTLEALPGANRTHLSAKFPFELNSPVRKSCTRAASRLACRRRSGAICGSTQSTQSSRERESLLEKGFVAQEGVLRNTHLYLEMLRSNLVSYEQLLAFKNGVCPFMWCRNQQGIH